MPPPRAQDRLVSRLSSISPRKRCRNGSPRGNRVRRRSRGETLRRCGPQTLSGPRSFCLKLREQSRVEPQVDLDRPARQRRPKPASTRAAPATGSPRSGPVPNPRNAASASLRCCLVPCSRATAFQSSPRSALSVATASPRQISRYDLQKRPVDNCGDSAPASDARRIASSISSRARSTSPNCHIVAGQER